MRVISLLVLICFTSMILVSPASGTNFGVLLGGDQSGDCGEGDGGFDILLILFLSIIFSVYFIYYWFVGWNGEALSGVQGLVCDYCTIQVPPERRGARVRVQSAIDAAGGLATGQSPAFAIVSVPENVVAEVASMITSCSPESSDARKSVLPAVPLPDPDQSDDPRGWFWPGLPEDDLPTSAPASTDVSFSVIYAAGFADYPEGSGVTAELTLYNAETWDVLTGQGGEVCNPCVQDLTEGQRRVDFVVQDLVDAAGGFTSGPVEVAATMVLSGDTSAAGATAVLARSDASNPDLITFSCGPGGEVGTESTATATSSSATIGLSLQPRENPSSGTSQIALRMGTQGMVDVTVHDLRGRLVRKLAQENFPSGESLLVWDGKDDSGVAVGSGVYLVRAAAGGQMTVEKLVRVK